MSKGYIIMLILILLGIALIFIGENLEESVITKTISAIGSTVLVSGSLGVINELFLKNTLLELMNEKISLKSEIENLGLVKVYAQYNGPQYELFFNNASQIDILHIYGNAWVNDNIEYIISCLKNKTCTVRVIMLDTESKFINGLAESFNKTPENLLEKMEKVERMWEDKVNQIDSKELKGTLQIFYHKGFPAASIYRADDELIVSPSVFTKEKRTKMPVMHYKKQNDSIAFNFYLQEIDALCNNSSRLIFEHGSAILRL